MKLVKRLALCTLLLGCASNHPSPIKQTTTVDPGAVSQFYHPVVGAAGDTTRTEPPQYIFAGSRDEILALKEKYLRTDITY
jgi:hypothetical protein